MTAARGRQRAATAKSTGSRPTRSRGYKKFLALAPGDPLAPQVQAAVDQLEGKTTPTATAVAPAASGSTGSHRHRRQHVDDSVTEFALSAIDAGADAALIVVAGTVGPLEARELTETLKACGRDGARRIVVDVTDASIDDPDVLTGMYDLARLMRARDGLVAIVAPRKHDLRGILDGDRRDAGIHALRGASGGARRPRPRRMTHGYTRPRGR